MRPRYLEIEGLQSFKDIEKIDFDHLSETGLFGIFGPTGSGKSTVLDAITLALYGEVNRAARGTQGIINTNSNIVKVAFTFDLLKDNTRKTYRVERVYHRKKGSENSCEAKIARLIELFDGGESPIADKEREVSAKVEELIGLRIEDFTRSVVLPQNKFQEFLFMEKAKKRDMLERIFYLEEYGKQLSERVNNRLTDIKFRVTNIDGQMSSLGNASEVALKDAEKKMLEAEASRKSIDKELKLVETQYNEAKVVWELSQDLSCIEEKERLHLEKQQGINEKKSLYENAVKAEDLSKGINKFRVAVKNLTDVERQLELMDKQLPELEIKLKEATTQHRGKAEELKNEIPLLIEQKHKLTEAQALQKEIAETDSAIKALRESYVHIDEQINVQNNELNIKKAELEQIDKDLEENRLIAERLKIDIDYRKEVQAGTKLEDDLNKAEGDKLAQQAKCTELSSKVLKLEGEMKELSEIRRVSQTKLEELKKEQKLHENSKPGDRSSIMQDINSFHNIKSIFEALKPIKLNADGLSTRLSDIKLQIELQRVKCVNSVEQKKVIEVKLSEINEELEKLKVQYDKNTSYILAQNLKDEAPCPVCGSLHHPAPASNAPQANVAEIENQIKEFRQQLTLSEKLYREAENQCIKAEEQLKGLEGLCTQIAADLAAKQEEYIKQTQKLPANLSNLPLDLMEDELTKVEQSNTAKLQDLDVWDKKLEGIKNSISTADEILAGQKLAESSKQAELGVNNENLLQSEKVINDILQLIKTKKEAYLGFIERLGIESTHKELERIEQNDRHAEEILEKTQQLQETAKAIRNIVEKLTEAKQVTEKTRVEIENDGKNLKNRKEEKLNKLRLLAGDKENFTFELNAVDEKITLIKQQEKDLAELAKSLETGFAELNTQKNTLSTQKEMYSKEVQGEEVGLKEALQKKGFNSIEEAEKSILPKERQDSLNDEIKAFEDMKRNLETQKSLTIAKLNGRNLTEEAWQNICNSYQAKKHEKEESISIFESSKNNHSNIKNNFGIWKELHKELQRYNGKREMLEQIQRLLRGNSFIEYVAEERLRYVAKEASETLGVMTKFRYALELDSDNGFVICDNANGGVRRLVSTLSGGETFLTALSLALALSKQIQLKGQSPLEFFFLDEGFGTLDSSLLDTVLDSLERLSSTQRVIGLISHVPELRNRTARRLIVEAPTSEGKGSQVRIEKA